MGAMGPRRSIPLYSIYCSVMALVAFRGVPGARAQDSDTCVEVTVSGLVDDEFPAASSLYTSNLGDDDSVRGDYINEGGEYFIWYSPTDPTEWTADTPDADTADCNGVWVLSSYPPGETFEDSVWYEASSGVQCDLSPDTIGSEWVRVDSDGGEEDVSLELECFASTDDDGDDGDGDGDDDDGDDGLSNRTIVVLLIVIGIGFMVLMCLGALACCVHRGKQGPEENIMPPGELPEEGSVIGGRAGEATKPGLHAHPEVQGAMHPRPEDWAPSYASQANGSIPTGSRSGPSVRSIGYS